MALVVDVKVEDEFVDIHDGLIKIIMVKRSAGYVRLVIDAPKEIKIKRKKKDAKAV